MTTQFYSYSVKKALWQRSNGLTCLLAVQEGFDREVELRIIAPGTKNQKERIERFKREFKVLARLDHPSIIPILDVGYQGGKCFYTTVVRKGPDLAELVERKPSGLEAKELVKVGVEIGEALAHMHAAQALHRGLNLSSIRLDEAQNRFFISEFSAVKALDLPSLTKPGTSPREASLPHPDEPATKKTDQFLLGVLLLALALPRERADSDIMFLASSNTVREDAFLELASAAFDSKFLLCLKRMTEVTPSKRFPSINELLTTLRQIERAEATRAVALAASQSSSSIAIASLAATIDRSRVHSESRPDHSSHANKWDGIERYSFLAGGGLAVLLLLFATFLAFGDSVTGPAPVGQRVSSQRRRRTGSGKTTKAWTFERKRKFGSLRSQVQVLGTKVASQGTDKSNFLDRWLLLKQYYRARRQGAAKLPFSYHDLIATRLRSFNDMERSCRRLDYYLITAAGQP